MVALGLLHTAEVHVATFAALAAELAPGADVGHRVDPVLLDDARARGLDDDVRSRVAAHLRSLRDDGAAVVVCTCSTLGGVAEALAEDVGVPVLRVDRPMAEAAVSGARRAGGPVLVVAALPSTLAPTRALLDEAAGGAAGEGRVEVLDVLVDDAWPRFEAGDQAGYLDAVAAAARDAVHARRPAVVVLAQASAAPAAERLADLGVPVLSSPRSAVERAAALLARSPDR